MKEDKLDKIYRISEILTNRFGESTPFMIITRLAEEVGELAEQVNNFESVGVKNKKMGGPKKEDLAKEAQDVIRAVLQLVQKYDARDEFEKSINASLQEFEARYKSNSIK
jgi:NTP pyrophosphatase (non-canonical NTP hydrolase)